MSFKTKILLSLVLTSILALGVFLGSAYQVLEAERVAQAFETTSMLATRDRDRIDSSTQSLLTDVNSVLRHYSPGSGTFGPSAQISLQQSPILHLELWTLTGGAWTRQADLRADASTEFKSAVSDIEGTPNKIRFTTAADPSFLKAMVEINAETRVLFFLPSAWLTGLPSDQGRFGSFLFVPASRTTLFPESKEFERTTLEKMGANTTGFDRVNRLEMGSETLFVAEALSAQSNLGVMVLVSESDLLRPWHQLVDRFSLLLGATICFALIIGLFLARQLTSSLQKLMDATVSLSKGDFDLDINMPGKDEVATLGRAFMSMSRRIQQLLLETREKGRMESELITAREVQNILFPSPDFRQGPFSLSGRYQSASECGGDWWNYWSHGDDLYFVMFDITGHGAAAAMVTSAVSALISIEKKKPVISLPELAATLNDSLCETYQGRRMMTGVIMHLNGQTGELKIVNASHPPVIKLPAGVDQSLTWQNVEYLEAGNNPRFGQLRGHQWAESTTTIKSGERIFLTTDGVVDLKNPSGREWGERRMVVSLLKAYVETESIEMDPELSLLGRFENKLAEYRQGAELPDDVTMMLVTWHERI